MWATPQFSPFPPQPPSIPAPAAARGRAGPGSPPATASPPPPAPLAAAPALPEGPRAAPLPGAPPGSALPASSAAVLGSGRPPFRAAAPVSFWSSKRTFIKLETNTKSTGTAFASPQGHGERGSPGDLGARGTPVSRRSLLHAGQGSGRSGPRCLRGFRASAGGRFRSTVWGIQGPGLVGATPGETGVQSPRLGNSDPQCEYMGTFRLPSPSTAGPEPLGRPREEQSGTSPAQPPQSWPIPILNPLGWGSASGLGVDGVGPVPSCSL